MCSIGHWALERGRKFSSPLAMDLDQLKVDEIWVHYLLLHATQDEVKEFALKLFVAN
jgi:hypothetical protein